jgi:hypothetical protein
MDEVVPKYRTILSYLFFSRQCGHVTIDLLTPVLELSKLFWIHSSRIFFYSST